MKKSVRNLCSALATLPLLTPAIGLAIDVDPRDYTALPEGANLNVLYARQLSADDLNVNGEAVTDDLDLDATIGIYRFVHFTKVMGLTVDPQVLVPFGTQDIGLLDDSSSGMGDAIFAATVWLHEDPEKQSYFGITPYVIAPTGEYDADKPVNLGTNRWSYILQAGYMTRLTEKLALDLVADVQWYGTNSDPLGGNRLKQDEAYQFQAMLSYDMTPSTYPSLRYSWRKGDEAHLDGVALGNEVDTSTMTIGINHWLVPGKLQIQAQYLRDLDVSDYGPELDAFQLRFLHLFGL